MAFNLNPLGITGPTQASPVQQTDYRNPTVNANVASYAVGSNMLNLTWPIPAYTQPNIAPRAPHPAAPLGDGNG